MDKEELSSIKNFISDPHIKEIAIHYAGCKTYTLNNRVIFNTAEEILEWWRNHNTYIPALDAAVSKGMHDFFKQKNPYSLSKNVFAVHFTV